ncbi:hypothetical protein [uncultured Sphingomonas sp.]|uniref:hypothetical protein n=1 Tax=uncultured Sphingomonas sp. TaxID=158754 RepID=UPI0035C9557B
MLSLTDRASIRAAARDPTIAPAVRAVLRLRHGQLGGGAGAHFHVVRPGDTLADAEAAVGWPMTLEGSPGWEWIERHGPVAEAVFILSDGGPAQVLLVPDDACPSITSLLREHAAG